MLTLEYSLIKYKTIKTKPRTLLNEYFPEYETIFYDILGASSLHILKNYFLPKILAKENILELACVLQKISRGKVKAAMVLKLLNAAKNSIGLAVV